MTGVWLCQGKQQTHCRLKFSSALMLWTHVPVVLRARTHTNTHLQKKSTFPSFLTKIKAGFWLVHRRGFWSELKSLPCRPHALRPGPIFMWRTVSPHHFDPHSFWPLPAGARAFVHMHDFCGIIYLLRSAGGVGGGGVGGCFLFIINSLSLTGGVLN